MRKPTSAPEHRPSRTASIAREAVFDGNRIFIIAYWLSLALLILVLIGVIAVSFATASPLDYWLQRLGIFTVVLCLVFLVGDFAGLVPLPVAIRNTIFTTFVVGVLGASATSIAHGLRTTGNDLDARLVVLDEKQTDAPRGLVERILAVKRRSDLVYWIPQDGNFRMLVAMVIKGYGKDPANRPRLAIDFTLSTQNGPADYEVVKINEMNGWKKEQKSQDLDFKIVARELEVGSDDVVSFAGIAWEASIGAIARSAKQATFIVEVRDEISRTWWRLEVPLTIGRLE